MDPSAHFFQIFGVVVELGDHQVHNFQMHALFAENFQGFQDRSQGGAYQFLIKFVSKAFESTQAAWIWGQSSSRGLGLM